MNHGNKPAGGRPGARPKVFNPAEDVIDCTSSSSQSGPEGKAESFLIRCQEFVDAARLDGLHVRGADPSVVIALDLEVPHCRAQLDEWSRQPGTADAMVKRLRADGLPTVGLNAVSWTMAREFMDHHIGAGAWEHATAPLSFDDRRLITILINADGLWFFAHGVNHHASVESGNLHRG